MKKNEAGNQADGTLAGLDEARQDTDDNARTRLLALHTRLFVLLITFVGETRSLIIGQGA